MVKRVFCEIGASVRELWRAWPMTATFMGIYGLMLACIYFFAATEQARFLQVIATLLLFLAAPVLFFVLHRMVLGFGRAEGSLPLLLSQSVRDFWRLAVVSIPAVLAALILNYLLTKIQAHAPASLSAESRNWVNISFSTLRLLLFGLALPLALVHLWLASLKGNLIETFKRAGRTLKVAFAPQSVMIYLLGAPVFALIPYFLIIAKTPAQKASTLIALLVARIVLALLFMLLGWLVTVGALKRTAASEA